MLSYPEGKDMKAIELMKQIKKENPNILGKVPDKRALAYSRAALLSITKKKPMPHSKEDSLCLPLGASLLSRSKRRKKVSKW